MRRRGFIAHATVAASTVAVSTVAITALPGTALGESAARLRVDAENCGLFLSGNCGPTATEFAGERTQKNA